MMLKDYKVINNMKEFRCMNIRQVKFYLTKQDEYKNLAKKQQELNKRFNKK